MYVLEKRNNTGVHLGKNFMICTSQFFMYTVFYIRTSTSKIRKNISLQGSLNETLQFCGHGGVDNGINNSSVQEFLLTLKNLAFAHFCVFVLHTEHQLFTEAPSNELDVCVTVHH